MLDMLKFCLNIPNIIIVPNNFSFLAFWPTVHFCAVSERIFPVEEQFTAFPDRSPVPHPNPLQPFEASA